MCKPKHAWDRCVEFHGHSCPGLAIGYRAALAAIERLGVTFSKDEELVCVTENDACGVDAVQVLTGCSIGKGNLIFRDRGKQAFSFFVRPDGSRLRLLFTKHLPKEGMDRTAMQKMILSAADEELFAFGEPAFEPPPSARIFTSVVCEQCGESAAEHKVRLYEGGKVCLDCCPNYSRGW